MTNGDTAAQRIIGLISGYIANQLTVQETTELEQWISEAPENQQLFEQLTDESYRNSILAQWKPETAENSLQNLKTKIAEKKKRVLWPRITAAASIILALSFGSYFLLQKHSQQQTAQNQKQDIAPGHNQATLTLANGQKIILRKGLTGKLAQQGGMLVQVNNGNAIAYTTAGSITNNSNTVLYNTLSTQKGEQSPYPLVLADGSKVWLNAESSITFPTAFNGKGRTVKITGEAYFEVVHNAAQPFKVMVNGQTVEDIGTHFNINSYKDEPAIKTTLLEGGVKVSTGVTSKILIPGQQTQVRGDEISIIPNANIKLAMAWKEGFFRYKDASIPAVMRQLARWYDVEIAYEGKIPERTFSGEIHRNVNASQVLEILSFTKIHFRIEGKKIIVTP